MWWHAWHIKRSRQSSDVNLDNDDGVVIVIPKVTRLILKNLYLISKYTEKSCILLLSLLQMDLHIMYYL